MVNKTSVESALPFSLCYPPTFSEKLCQEIAKNLKEINVQKQAQRLVDYFATRLQSGTVREPIAYFIDLKNRLLNGQLDLSDSTAKPKNPSVASPNKVDRTLSALESEYQQAVSDYLSIEKMVDHVKYRENCSFDNALEIMNYTKIWPTAVIRLKKVIKALEVYQKDNPAPQAKTPPPAARTSKAAPQSIRDILADLSLLPS
jgi:hypothetical protein